MSQLEYSVVMETVLPVEGSQAGGTEITISGKGFVSRTSPDSNFVEWDPQQPILSDAYERALIAYDNECSEGWENVVMVGVWECDIITADHTTITCTTPANQNPGTTNVYDVTVNVLCKDVGSVALSDTLSNGFTYSVTLTPTITGVTPPEGSVHGGNSLSITGTGFSDDPLKVSVMVRYERSQLCTPLISLLSLAPSSLPPPFLPPSSAGRL